jgi:precorrin-2 dehydrogenase/sirohydrochlorin ferrochelatase
MPTPKARELALTLLPGGFRVLIAGGGKVAAQKLKALPAGLAVKVVAPEIGTGLKRRGVTQIKRRVRLGDVDSSELIFAATDDAVVNASLAKRAKAKGKLVSVADAPELGNFSLPAVAKAGPIRISVSTSGASPAVSKALRAWLEARLRGSKLLKLTSELGRKRAWLKSHGPEKEKLLRAVRDPRAFSKLLK